MAVYWYTFNVKDNSRRFFWGVCGTDEMEFDLYTTEGGTWDDPTGAEPTVIGRAQLYFTSETRGVFVFDTGEHDRNAINLELIARQVGRMSGAWFQPNRKGEGFTISFIPASFTGEMCVGYWYSYGPDKGDSDETGSQRWYMFSGNKVGDGYELTVYEILNGYWMYNSPTDLTVAGNATLAIKGPNHIAFDYHLDADGVKGDGGFKLERLF